MHGEVLEDFPAVLGGVLASNPLWSDCSGSVGTDPCRESLAGTLLAAALEAPRLSYVSQGSWAKCLQCQEDIGVVPNSAIKKSHQFFGR